METIAPRLAPHKATTTQATTMKKDPNSPGEDPT